MARIEIQEAQGWAEPTKLPIPALNPLLLDQVEVQILSRLGSAYDTSTWVDAITTPELVRSAIAMQYVGTEIMKAYSEDPGSGNQYARWLLSKAEDIIKGILDGTIELPGISPASTVGQPSFYPNDLSSIMDPTWDDRSLGPEKFSMGGSF